VWQAVFDDQVHFFLIEHDFEIRIGLHSQGFCRILETPVVLLRNGSYFCVGVVLYCLGVEISPYSHTNDSNFDHSGFSFLDVMFGF